LGNARRGFFYGSGINNLDLTFAKLLRITGSQSLELRLERFNFLNHARFYGATSVDGEVNDPHSGEVVSAAAPHLVHLVAEFIF
jgi:hypothetical protein